MGYTFQFDHLTIGDMRILLEATQTNNTALFIEFVAKCYQGDMYALPAREATVLAQQFTIALQQWYKDIGADSGTPDAARILKDLFPDG